MPPKLSSLFGLNFVVKFGNPLKYSIYIRNSCFNRIVISIINQQQSESFEGNSTKLKVVMINRGGPDLRPRPFCYIVLIQLKFGCTIEIFNRQDKRMCLFQIIDMGFFIICDCLWFLSNGLWDFLISGPYFLICSFYVT